MVILAAGRGRRFGSAKQEALLRGRPLLVHAVSTALAVAAGQEQVLVVTGAHQFEVAQVLQTISCRQPGPRLCHNPLWPTGLASSLQAALHHIQACCPAWQAVIFMLADQPFVPAALIRALLAQWQEGRDLAAPALAGRLFGAPALFARSYWPEILQLAGDRGARSVLVRHQQDVVLVKACASWLVDIDTPADLDRGETGL